MTPVATALREGVLSELAGLAEAGISEESVSRLVRRFAADVKHASLVKSVLKTLAPVFEQWDMNSEANRKLDWGLNSMRLAKYSILGLPQT